MLNRLAIRDAEVLLLMTKVVTLYNTGYSQRPQRYSPELEQQSILISSDVEQSRQLVPALGRLQPAGSSLAI